MKRPRACSLVPSSATPFTLRGWCPAAPATHPSSPLRPCTFPPTDAPTLTLLSRLLVSAAPSWFPGFPFLSPFSFPPPSPIRSPSPVLTPAFPFSPVASRQAPEYQPLSPACGSLPESYASTRSRRASPQRASRPAPLPWEAFGTSTRVDNASLTTIDVFLA